MVLSKNRTHRWQSRILKRWTVSAGTPEVCSAGTDDTAGSSSAFRQIAKQTRLLPAAALLSQALLRQLQTASLGVKDSSKAS
jgi:hypothetical protein